jgi:hypothetical protein
LAEDAVILEKTIKASELPEALRAGAPPEGFVRISIQPITENGFTEEFEREVLEAEKEGDLSPPMSAKEFIETLKSWML